MEWFYFHKTVCSIEMVYTYTEDKSQGLGKEVVHDIVILVHPDCSMVFIQNKHGQGTGQRGIKANVELKMTFLGWMTHRSVIASTTLGDVKEVEHAPVLEAVECAPQ